MSGDTRTRLARGVSVLTLIFLKLFLIDDSDEYTT